MLRTTHIRIARATCLTLAALMVMLLATAGALAETKSSQVPENAADPAIDWPMFDDPQLTDDVWKIVFQPRLVEVWQAGLEHHDADMNIAVAKDIVTAVNVGSTEVKALGPTLRIVANDVKRGWSVRAAAIQALAAVDATDAAEDLLTISKSGTVMTVLACDAALAKWKYAPAETAWRARAMDTAASVTLRISAVKSLAAASFTGAGDDVATLAFSPQTPVNLRLAAGDALGQLVDQGLAAKASELLSADLVGASADQVRRARGIAVARALRLHKDDAAVAVMLELVRTGDAEAAAICGQTLLTNRPSALDSLAMELAGRDDVAIRMVAAKALANLKTNAAVGALGDMLGDAHPKVRGLARQMLRQLDGEEGLKVGVRAKAKAMLSSGRWQAVEQATLLLGQVGDQSAVTQIAAQIKHARWEVRMATVAALRWLDAREHAPALLQRAEDILAEVATVIATQTNLVNESRQIELGDEADSPAQVQRLEILTLMRDGNSMHLRQMDMEVVQLLQTLGRMNAAIVEPLARRLVPKGAIMFGDSRGAAIWTLGLLKDGKLDSGLAAQLTARLNDTNDPMNPEFEIVRQFSAVALGRMKAAEHLGSLRNHVGIGTVGHSAMWAIEKITGEKQPPLPDNIASPPGWTLTPLTD